MPNSNVSVIVPIFLWVLITVVASYFFAKPDHKVKE